jgi:hypothetical protein
LLAAVIRSLAKDAHYSLKNQKHSARILVKSKAKVV